MIRIRRVPGLTMRNRGRWFVIAGIVITSCLMGPAECARANSPDPRAFLAWDTEMKATNVPAGQSVARFAFSFTNVSSGDVTILNVRPSCGCTTVQLPKLPWLIPAGTTGRIGVSVNLAGKSGTLIKTVKVSTDKSTNSLMAQITIVSLPNMAQTQRLKNEKIAAANRQAVFGGDCASCHVVPGEGKSGQALYVAVCGVCHEGENRATMVPDLHNLKVPTNADFWGSWITYGKAGTLMPAFSQKEGGPLTDAQIASLTNYLADAIFAKPGTPPGPLSRAGRRP